MKGFIKAVSTTLCGIYIALVITTCASQDSLIFFPRAYQRDELPDENSHFCFASKSGEQTAFYLGKEIRPEMIWIFFNGNGGRALGWRTEAQELVERNPERAAVLFDYPGYGKNPGKPGRESIRQSTDAMLIELANKTQYSEKEIVHHIGLVGHSLGAAVALESAAAWKTKRVIAISPFTSMLDIANRKIPAPLTITLKHRWDNRAAISNIAEMDSASVIIYHGTADTLIPIEMSHELQRLEPNIVVLNEVNGAGHNDIISIIQERLILHLCGNSLQ